MKILMSVTCILILGTGAIASQNIEVTINGKTYSCSEGASDPCWEMCREPGRGFSTIGCIESCGVNDSNRKQCWAMCSEPIRKNMVKTCIDMCGK